MRGQRVIVFEPEGIRRAYEAAGRHLLAVVGDVPERSLNEPALGSWSLRDLIGHASRAFTTVPEYLAAADGMAIELWHPLDYVTAYRSAHGDPAAIAERARRSGEALGSDLCAGLQSLFVKASDAVASRADDAPLRSPAGVMRLIDYLLNRIFELTVHTEDIKVSRGIERDAPGDAVTVSLIFAAGLAAESPRYRTALFGLTGRGGLPAGYSVL
jgi:uncharacterized protein (TIGR03083 family)